jgi:hypothetical protein
MIGWLVLLASLTVTAPPPAAGVLIASGPDKHIMVSGTVVLEAADESGHAIRGVLITQGEWSGCRGVVEDGDFRRR